MEFKPKFTSSFVLIAGFIAILWVVEVINMLTGHHLNTYGILPRTLSGLIGIPTALFLHGGIFHLLLNTIPLAILGSLVVIHGRVVFWETTVLITLAGGGGVWLIGRPAYHIGASGLIFGYFGFLVSRGFVKKSIGSLFISMATIFIYGGLLWGVLPVSGHVSWEGHLCGLLAGILAARLEQWGDGR